MSQPEVSFVVASYNHGRYVTETLTSILSQTYSDFELLVVDDGSSDDTLRMAWAVACTDRRVQVYARSHEGVVAARNRGVVQSRGQYVSVVDSDDFLPPERTERQVSAFDANPGASLVWGDAWLANQQGELVRRFSDVYPPVAGDFSSRLFSTYCFVPAQSVMFRRSAFDQSGPFWGPGPNTDYLKWIELGLLGEAVRLGDSPLGYWRLHGKNASAPPIGRRVEQYGELRQALQGLATRHPDLAQRVGRQGLRGRYGRCHFMGGFYAGLQRSWGLARAQFAEAYVLDPSLLNAVAWASTLPLLRAVSGPLFSVAARGRGLW